jgi:hypothetical protein
MSAEIKHIHNQPIEQIREPNKGIVEILERLIDEAKKGEITSFAYAVVRPNQFIGEGFIIGPMNNYALNTAVDILHLRTRNAVMGVENA